MTIEEEINMTTQVLEQMFETTFRPSISQDRMYQTIDTYTAQTSALYSGKLVIPKQLTIRDMPSIGAQLHIHEGPRGTAHIKTYKNQYLNMNSYDAAMLDLLLDKAKNPKYQK
jgi:hypothetical protein